MINLLQSLLPDLSFLTSTLLFIRCYSVCQVFPELFQNIIGEYMMMQNNLFSAMITI
jgi:hypothetical protein